MCYSRRCQFFFNLMRCDPTRAMASSFLRFLDHKQRRTTIDRTPLDEWSAVGRDLYLTTHNIPNRQTDKHLCPWWDSNPQSPQASGRRLTPYTARSLGPAVSLDAWIWNTGGQTLTWEHRDTRRKPVPMPLCLPIIPNGLTWDLKFLLILTLSVF